MRNFNVISFRSQPASSTLHSGTRGLDTELARPLQSPQFLETAWVFYEAQTRRTRAVGASAVWTHYLLRLNHIGVKNILTKARLATKATLDELVVEAKRMNFGCVAEVIARAHGLERLVSNKSRDHQFPLPRYESVLFFLCFLSENIYSVSPLETTTFYDTIWRSSFHPVLLI